jgi:ATP-dependent helicase HrpA
LSSPLAIKPLYNKLDDCLSADKLRLKRRITQLAQKVNDISGVDGKGAEKKAANSKASKRDIAVSEDSLKAQFEKLEGDIDASIEKRNWRKDNLPKVEYRCRLAIKKKALKKRLQITKW